MDRKAKEPRTDRTGPKIPARTGLTNAADFEHAQLAELIQRTKAAPESLTSDDVLRLQRAIGNRALDHLLAQRFSDRLPQQPAITATPPLHPTVQRDDYPYGAANSLPHIHRYGPDFHVKFVDTARRRVQRINLVVNGIRTLQSNINEAFDAIRASYGEHAVLAKMAELLRGVPKHESDQ